MATRKNMIVNHKENAEICNGVSNCKKKADELLALVNLPKGLLPLNDIIQIGHNFHTGFVWIKIQNKVEHRFRAIGKTVAYDTEITTFIEDRRMRRLTGVRSKELMVWISISDIFVNEQDQRKITFANGTGLSRTFPVSAFEIEELKEA